MHAREAEFWGKVSVITSGEVTAGEVPIRMQVKEEALRVIALPSTLSPAPISAGGSSSAVVNVYNVDQAPLVWEMLESEYSGPAAWPGQQPASVYDPAKSAPVRCHETASRTLNAYNMSTRPPVSFQSCGGRCGGVTRYRINEGCVPQYFACAGTAEDSAAYPDCNAAYHDAGATSASDCPPGCTYMGTNHVLDSRCASVELASPNAAFDCQNAGYGSQAGSCVYIAAQSPITRDCTPMQPNAANSSQCSEPLSNWRRACEAPATNPSIDMNNLADVLANGDSYLGIGASIAL
eukprot:COSAG02_NODE_18786_length_919_cov_1.285366_1_plen_292_part_10